MSERINFYGRLGDNAQLDLTIIQAEAMAELHPGIDVEITIGSNTAEVYIDSIMAMKAISKSPNAWVFMYNPQFYPKPLMQMDDTEKT